MGKNTGIIVLSAAALLGCGGIFGILVTKTVLDIVKPESPAKVESAQPAALSAADTAKNPVKVEKDSAVASAVEPKLTEEQKRLQAMELQLANLVQELKARDVATHKAIENLKVEDASEAAKRMENIEKQLGELGAALKTRNDNYSQQLLTISKSVGDLRDEVESGRAASLAAVEDAQKALEKVEEAEKKVDARKLSQPEVSERVIVKEVTVPTTTTTSTTTIYVKSAPPSPRFEIKPFRPTKLHRWVGGYWHWTGSRYVWISGKWVMPPQSECIWIAPTYTFLNIGGSRRMTYKHGYWKHHPHKRHHR